MNNFLKDRFLITGLLLILLSTIAYGIEVFYITQDNNDFNGIFFFHYLLALIYFGMSWRKLRIRFFHLFSKESLRDHILLLVLFNISAYSLNRSLVIFNDSVLWVSVFLLLENIALIVFAFLIKPSRLINLIVTFLAGVALLFNFYQLLIVLPYSQFALFGIPLFGMSLLLLVPLFYIIIFIRVLRNIDWSLSHSFMLTIALSFTILLVSFKVYQWKSIENRLLANNLEIDAPFRNNELPDWISMSQQIPNSPMAEAYLKSGIVYQTFPDFNRTFSNFGSRNFSEKRLHDPLITICNAFSEKDALDNKTKINALNFLYNTRHQSSDRFWSGDDLTTEQVITNIEVFPNERLTFTEMILTVANHTKRRWQNQQEAVYTFQLPEGGVVTSLSLWIEGEERKAILTSKKKAENAYNTIVGREMRDPSVVYWMEGNQIRVRVFPCTKEEDRKFKIGVTAPLMLNQKSNELIYESVTFQGPDYSNAKSAVYLVSHGEALKNATYSFSKEPKYLSWKGNYQPEWSFSIESTPVQNVSFSFGNESYQLVNSSKPKESFMPSEFYLDLSSHWTKEELSEIDKMLEGKKVKVCTGGASGWLTENIGEIAPSSLPYFTLFPFHQITNPEAAVLITKGGMNTPNLQDLEGTTFKQKLFKSLSNSNAAIHVIDIGNAPSSYFRSLKEFGVVAYQNSSLNELKSYFQSGKFPMSDRDSSIVDIPVSGLSVKISDVMGNSTGSDHLMRLYYYQLVMNQIGQKYFTEDKNQYIEDELVAYAEKANIVTPISSLIVLETQKDYDRFGIKRNKNSLGNASIGNSGAVPEPHEWAMIILGVVFMSFFYLKFKRKSVTL